MERNAVEGGVIGPTFHYTGWLIGILTMVFYNPFIIGHYNPLYQTTNQGFEHRSTVVTHPWSFHCQKLQKKGCVMHILDVFSVFLYHVSCVMLCF